MFAGIPLSIWRSHITSKGARDVSASGENPVNRVIDITPKRPSRPTRLVRDGSGQCITRLLLAPTASHHAGQSFESLTGQRGIILCPFEVGRVYFGIIGILPGRNESYGVLPESPSVRQGIVVLVCPFVLSSMRRLAEPCHCRLMTSSPLIARRDE